jgi:phosphoribosylformylglycinamidine synthase
MVRTNTIQLLDADAAVIRLKGTRKALALKTDCNARFVYLNPLRGTKIAVAEAARNVACVGAEPIAITNCLNFGNPYDPEIYWQFTEAIAGMKEACIAFKTPVTGGNVSFYNESPRGAIMPTPVIGMLGLINDIDSVVGAHFKNKDDAIIELGVNRGEIGGSEYLTMVKNSILGEVPEIDLEYESRLHKLCQIYAISGLVNSMHDISDGGLIVTLIESLNGKNDLGCEIDLGRLPKLRSDFLIFSESQSRVIVSCSKKNIKQVLLEAQKNKIDANEIGIVTDSKKLEIGSMVNLSLEETLNIYNRSIENEMPIEGN